MDREKPTRAQDLLWRLEALGFDLVGGAMRRLPLDVASDLGAGLLGWLGPMVGANRTVVRNLQIAFPEKSQAEVRALAKDHWRHFGRLVAEFPMVDRIVGDPTRIEVVNGERLAALAENGGPAVLIGGHFSNFEIMAATIAKAGMPFLVSYRATNNPHFDARIRESRARYGVTRLAAKGSDGSRELLRALGRGETVGILSDQKFNAGVAAPLFGVDAWSPPGAVALALRYGVPMLPVSVQRTERARFRVVVHEPIELAVTGDRTADIEAGVRRMNAFLEDRIRARPAQWFWTHKRWPKEMYKRA
jgi:KDO2-lipid IV(A) lauroyltransferase